MTESTKIDYVSIVQDLRDEADLCRNETATDIADLLDDAASCIVAMKSQFTALRSELAAAQEARQRAEADAFTMAAGQCCVESGGLMANDHGHQYCDMERQRDELRERAQRAEALAEKINQILLPDPHDEREVSAEWQVKAIRAAIDAARGKP